MGRHVNNPRVNFSFTNPVNTYDSDHVIVIGDYDHVLHDYLKRDFAISVKVNSVKALGYPHNWNEQKAIPHNTTAIDPRTGFTTYGPGAIPSYKPPTLNTNYDRDNWKKAFVRCYATGIRYEFFDKKMAADYGSFEDLIAKDTNDMMVDFTKTQVNDFWNGTSDMEQLDASNLTYSGVISQITDVTPIASGNNIADSIITKMTNMMARLDYTNYPDVIAMNPATYDIIVKQEQARQNYIREYTTEIIPGVSVPAIMTPMGQIPILLEPFIKPETADGKMTHKIVALNTSMIDRIWMFDDGPKVYEVASADVPNANDRLLTDKFVLDFANYIVHGAHTGAHFIMTYEVTV